MNSVISYVKSKGRVTKSDLANECNRIIRVNPKGEDLEKIEKEEKDLIRDVQN